MEMRQRRREDILHRLGKSGIHKEEYALAMSEAAEQIAGSVRLI